MNELERLEARWRLSQNLEDFRELREAYLASGLEEALVRIELEFLALYLEDFHTKFFEWNRFNSPIPKTVVDESVKNLTEQAKLLDRSPSYHYYRETWDSLNHHIRGLATLHNALRVDAWRDDDWYFGDAVFRLKKDAEDFKRSLLRHHQDFGESADFSVTKDSISGPTLFRISWRTGK